MHCPRKGNISAVFKFGQEEDHYRADHTCSWCGSLSGDEFMRRLEEGSIEISGTDKNYKVYINPVQGTPSLGSVKFYFQHLNEEQMRRFVELYNQREIKYCDGSGLYVTPFFMTNL